MRTPHIPEREQRQDLFALLQRGVMAALATPQPFGPNLENFTPLRADQRSDRRG